MSAKSGSNLSIRLAHAADAGAIADLYLLSRKRFLPYAPLVHADDEVRRWIAEQLLPAAAVTVVVEAGEIVGMMATTRSDGCGWIDQLYLHPQAVGRGIGARLLILAQQQLGSPIRLYTFQPNLRARRFYERHGFRAIAFGDGSANEEQCPDVLYEWALMVRNLP